MITINVDEKTSNADWPKRTDDSLATLMAGGHIGQRKAFATKSNENHDERGRFASSSGRQYFDDAALKRAAGQSHLSRELLIDMPIRDFLAVAERIDEPSPQKEKTVESVLNDGKKFSDIPMLGFSLDKQGNAVVVAHEGRHRAMALESRGVTHIPVVLISQERAGASIRWGVQSDPTSRDRLKTVWPTRLIGQTSDTFGPSTNTIQFPVSDLRTQSLTHKSLKGGPGSGNYGHAGRPGEAGGSGPGAPAAETVQRRTSSAGHEHLRNNQLFDLVHARGGFTYNPLSDKLQTKGFSVSLFPARSRAFDPGKLTRSDVVKFFKANLDMLSKPENCFGAWHDKEKDQVFLDVSRVVHSGKEAKAICFKYDQKGYFNLHTHKEVICNPNATSGGQAKPK